MGQWLGRGLAKPAAIIDPVVFVIGGECPRPRPADRAGPGDVQALAHRARLRPAADVKLAHLGPEAGLVGAADLARRRV